jgi:hypothetical protein
MSWNRTGQHVMGRYCGEVFCGTVYDSRVKYGGMVQHSVELNKPIEVCGTERTEVLVDEVDLL